jgi:hypothetical protein
MAYAPESTVNPHHPRRVMRTTIAARRLRQVLIVAAVVMSTTGLLPAGAATGVYRHYHGAPLNDVALTPGSIFHVTLAAICTSGYSSRVRDVPESEKARVYASYGITHRAPGQYEIDHLISLELGGSNAVSNLWPEPNDHPRGYLNSKDILENRLHDMVCSGQLSLSVAQARIASNWVALYHQVFATWPASTPRTVTPTSTPTTTPPPVVNAGASVRILSIVRVVAPGSRESLIAHTTIARDSCTLVVTLPSGRQSTESGLGPAHATTTGTVTWSWGIGPTTGPGVAHVVVTCAAGTAHGSFSIT